VHAATDAAGALTRAAATSLQRRLRGADPVAHPINAPRTRFNASLTGDRQVACGHASLADLKTISGAFGVTINDVVLAACTLGLRGWLQSHDEVPDRALVCSVPVSIHAGAGSGDSANQVSSMFVHLPVHLGDPVEVLELVHHGCQGAKEMHSSLGADVISDLVDLAPALLFRGAVRLYSEVGIADHMAPVHNLVVSNVMGPTFPTYLAGAEVTGMFPFGPLMEGAGLNITVVSNNGDLDIGLLACPDLVPELESLLDGIIDGIATLRDAAEDRVAP
jgi:WS/DGAT/MGAT family acyltransferase